MHFRKMWGKREKFMLKREHSSLEWKWANKENRMCVQGRTQTWRTNLTCSFPSLMFETLWWGRTFSHLTGKWKVLFSIRWESFLNHHKWITEWEEELLDTDVPGKRLLAILNRVKNHSTIWSTAFSINCWYLLRLMV